MESFSRKPISKQTTANMQRQAKAAESFLPTECEYNVNSVDFDEAESSTPFYTPLDFLQTSFEFPSPRSDKIIADVGIVPGSPNISDTSSSSNTTIIEHKVNDDKRGFAAAIENSSPSAIRKTVRQSLNEKRTDTFQKSQDTTVELQSRLALLDDKENTKPKVCERNDSERYSGSDKTSPAISEETGGGSPKIAISNEHLLTGQNHLTYSPKLLASLQNIQSGSPLGIISSAVYKNGNYFKFPEIDHVVQERNDKKLEQQRTERAVANADTVKAIKTESTANKLANRFQSSQILEHSDKLSLSQSVPMSSVKTEALNVQKNRKNKNNLKIQITDVPTESDSVAIATEYSPKPKTPTIKSTKGKALSLDSAGVDSELTIIVSNINDLCISCDEINKSTECPHFISHNGQVYLPSDTVSQRNISTSLVQLPSTAHMNKNRSDVCYTEALNKAYALRASCRKNPGSIIYDCRPSKQALAVGSSSEGVMLNEEEKLACAANDKLEARGSCLEMPSPFNNSTATGFPRGSLKHNMLLHASNANLKTLPETLTLVEFCSKAESLDCTHKQKSMDLPSKSMFMGTSLKTSHAATPSSSNLLQRRGSNHSLTLNLHGSCGNLLGSCRSGLSVSNYSLGSMDNSANSIHLNSKSSCNLDLSTTPKSSLPKNTNNAQGVKQSLFSRRGSNNSFTLTNLTANSCGNLNSLSTQNSLNTVNVGNLSNSPGQTTATTPKRGLLERRGSNQSLTLNAHSSFGGIGQDCFMKNFITMDINGEKNQTEMQEFILPACCSERKFSSSESLHKANKQFSDLNQTHKRNANQLCFGSVSDLKPTEQMGGSYELPDAQNNKREQFDFQESTVCTCSGVRNIMTRPLSPQTTSEEFKMYLANIQLLQNASNVLNQFDLIKLNHIFDNNLPTNNLGNHSVYSLNLQEKKETDALQTFVTTSEDYDIAARYQQVVGSVLHKMCITEDEQKKIFCDLHKEFWDLPLNHQEKPMVFGTHAKNRYKTILPNENSRVILDTSTINEKCFASAKDVNLLQQIEAKKVSEQASIVDAPSYINANYIKGPDFTSKCYIATQGPLSNTIFEFWLMTYQNTCKYLQSVENAKGVTFDQNYYQKIVMLTNFIENHRQKCAVYFPVELNEVFISAAQQENVPITVELTELLQPYLYFNAADVDRVEAQKRFIDIQTFDLQLDEQSIEVVPKNTNFFVIKNIGIVKKNGFSIRKMVVLYCTNAAAHEDNIPGQLHIKQFCCYHYWYPDWPDHRSPKDINTLLDICLHILNLGKCEQEFTIFEEGFSANKSFLESQNPALYLQDLFNALQPLPIIHCSAGIGRTGCLTAILNSVRQLRQSFACSLLSMTNILTATPQLVSCPEQIFNVVNVSLPSNVAKQLEVDHLNLCTDTESSFTYNTLRFVNYISQIDTDKDAHINSANTIDTKKENTNTNTTISSPANLPPLSLTQLCAIPDVHVDILGIVCNLRLQRGGMVQNSEQYELIHRAVCSYLKRTFALRRF